MTPQAKIYVPVRPVSLNGWHTIEFLQHLLRYAGLQLLVIWDGSPIHRRANVQEFLANKSCRGIWVERLPGYAPDLNPWDAGGWDRLKHCGDAEPGLLGPGRIALATPSRDRSPATETPLGTKVLSGCRTDTVKNLAHDPKLVLNPRISGFLNTKTTELGS
jgi:DDE superfamily endonuclease